MCKLESPPRYLLRLFSVPSFSKQQISKQIVQREKKGKNLIYNYLIIIYIQYIIHTDIIIMIVFHLWREDNNNYNNLYKNLDILFRTTHYI